MWIVELALCRPLSVAVMALLMLVLRTRSFAVLNVFIFPAINLPVVMLVSNYPGLSAIDMERRILLITEPAYSTSVNGIDVLTRSSPSRLRSVARADHVDHGLNGGCLMLGRLRDSPRLPVSLSMVCGPISHLIAPSSRL
jgi:Cu/Ag efflux pump CusA